MNIRICLLLALGITFIIRAHAEETGKKAIFTCFNRAQTADAPAVTIVEDDSGKQYVEFTNRGSVTSVELSPFSGEIVLDGSVYTGKDVKVVEYNNVENPAAQSTVTSTSLGLTYTCSRVLK